MKKEDSRWGILLNGAIKAQIITSTALFILWTLAVATMAASGDSQSDDSNHHNLKLTRESLAVAENYYHQGIVNAKQKNYRGAIADYNKAIALIPNAFDYYYNRGLAKRDLNDDDGALSDFDKAIKLAPFVDEPRVRHYLASIFWDRARIRFKMGNKKGATDDVNRVLELDPQHVKIGGPVVTSTAARSLNATRQPPKERLFGRWIGSETTAHGNQTCVYVFYPDGRSEFIINGKQVYTNTWSLSYTINTSVYPWEVDYVARNSNDGHTNTVRMLVEMIDDNRIRAAFNFPASTIIPKTFTSENSMVFKRIN